MIYGYVDENSGRFRRYTRISSSAVLVDRKTIAVSDRVWIAHYVVLDGSNGIEIGEGVQIGFWCGVFTHGSHKAVRFLGTRYIGTDRNIRPGYMRGKVTIGSYAYLSSGTVILPGMTIGKGALIAAGSVVAHDVPDFGIVRGNPARIVGDTQRLDAPHPGDLAIRDSYFARDEMAIWLAEHPLNAAAA